MKRLIALLGVVLSIAVNAQVRSAVAKDVALWYEAFHENAPSLLDRILAPQWVDIPPAPRQPPGPQGSKQILLELRSALPVLTIEIRDVVVQANRCVPWP